MTISPPYPTFAPTVEAYHLAGDVDDTASFVRGFAANYALKGTPGRVYVVNGVVMNGRKFYGNGCVVHDAVGAPFCFQLAGYRPEIRDVLFQDQGHAINATTNVGGFAAGDTVISLASVAGMAANQQILLEDTSGKWQQTLIQSVGANSVTLQQGADFAAAAGLRVVSSFGLINVTDSHFPKLTGIDFDNCNVGIVVASSTSQTEIHTLTLRDVFTDGCRYSGVSLYGGVNNATLDNILVGFGVVDIYNYVGAGVAGAFSCGFQVNLIRDLTVTVDGVAKVYNVDWTFLDAKTIAFLAGHYPANLSAVQIVHYHCTVRPFVHDARGNPAVPAGAITMGVRCLGGLVGAELRAVQADVYAGLMADTNMFYGVWIDSVVNQVLLDEIYSSWTRTAINITNSAKVTIGTLATNLTPSNQINPQIGLNIEIAADAPSTVDVALASWSSLAYLWGGAGAVTLHGGQKFVASSAAAMTAGANAYLGPEGQRSVNLPLDFVERNAFVVDFYGKVNISPGAGQTVTFNLIANANTGSPVTVASIVISGAGVFLARLAAPVTVAALSTLSLQAVYSAGAAASFPIAYFLKR